MTKQTRNIRRWIWWLVPAVGLLGVWWVFSGDTWVTIRVPAGPPTQFIAGQHAGQILKDSRTPLNWVWMPPGRFSFGCTEAGLSIVSSCGVDALPAREVELAGFWMLKTEVTVDAYEGCVFARQCRLPPRHKQCTWNSGRPQHPMNCLTRSEAEGFCHWLGASLPSATLWEYAAKSGGSALYPWGDEAPSGKRANICDAACAEAFSPEERGATGVGDFAENDGFAATAPVGSFPAGATPWGLLDIAGNVGEWTSNPFDTGPQGELRGGGWASLTDALSTTARREGIPDYRGIDVGFRCAR